MSDCHSLFQTYLDRISPSSTKLDYLRTSRDAIREKVGKHFREKLELSPPDFWGQGSYASKTLIVPLDGEYDIDDGVYLTCLDKNKDKWKTCDTVHKWVYDAVENHTDKKPIDKNTCVRVIYANQYHVDLPIYNEHEEKYYLAEKGERGWHPTSPRAVVEWFRNQVKDKGEQLRRAVKYFKGWADFKSSEAKMPSGFLLTVLVNDNFEPMDRDDSCFSNIAKKIYDSISTKFEVKNPTDEEEMLSDRLSDTQKDIFKLLLAEVLKNASEALREESQKESSKLWQKVFGSRFPTGDDENSKKTYTSGPALLKNDARSAR
jgi:hypothetical protein